MSSKVNIILFRNDLRVSDNEALYRAVKNSDKVIPLYVFDNRQFERDRWGFVKTGPFRAKFLLESVRNLRDKLRGVNADLIVRRGSPETIIKELCDKFEVDKVYLQKEVTSEEVLVEKAIEKITNVEYIWGHTLFHIKDIPYKIADFPDVFTNFRKRTEKESTVREIIPVPDKIVLVEGIEPGELPSIQELGLTDPPVDERAVICFFGGADAARERLNHYFWNTKELQNYKWKRNGLLGEEYSSKFSPWLANGSLSPREIYWEVKTFEQEVKKNVSTYWLVFELIWRDFFRFHSAKIGNALFLPGGRNGLTRSLGNNQSAFNEWRTGKTRHDFVNASMVELMQTGWMSNRGRQVVASNLVNDYKLDWRMGAAWFESMLIDYDPCSNYGNWQYVAGVGTDPRKDRYFNIRSQAERYDPKGEFVKHWLDT